ncbi:MAG: hypothetical protein O4805_24975 [Trichodesmium sp. St16_bin2-tuft]|nr:hypothetical protein [Trichodesmium sp. St16_bin2-tuft]
MHARSLQGFGYGDVVHQFENRYKIIPHLCNAIFFIITSFIETIRHLQNKN